MTVNQARHICRAAAAVANVEYVFVFGSNAIVFWLEEVGIRDTEELFGVETSRELVLSVSEENPELNTLVDAVIGELSLFDSTFGVYAHANPAKGLFKAPKSWVERAKIVQEQGVKIVAPHPVDLVFSKMLGFREKDWLFCKKVMRLFGIVPEDLESLAEEYLLEHPQEASAVKKALAVLKGKLSKESDSEPPAP